MKIIYLILFLLLSSSGALAKKKTSFRKIWGLNFSHGQSKKKFSLYVNKNKSYRLEFIDNKKRNRRKIRELDGDIYTNQITRIFWDKKYRLRGSKNCKIYARITIPGEKNAKICQKDAKLVGKLYGLSNGLLKLIRK